MSIKTLHDNTIENRELVVNTEGWVRNPSWLTLPNVTGTEEKFVGLYAIWPGDVNPFSVTASGAYYVQLWTGQPVVNQIAGNSINTNYVYNYAAYNDTNAPVTLSNSIVTRNSHGYTDGMKVDFHNIVTTTGISSGIYYYVIQSTQNTFQISLTHNGTPVIFTGSGSATLLPYKQAIVTITPQTPNNLTSLNLQVRYTAYSAQAYSTGWLDMNIGGPFLTTLTIGGSTVIQSLLQRCNIVSNNLTTTSSLFNSCRRLQSVPLFDTSNVTIMSGMFNSCFSLQTVPLFNTSKVINMSTMFQNCFLLQTVPLFNTSAVTNMNSMFSYCYDIQTIPLLNTSKVIDMAAMFTNCYSLQTVPLFNTSAVTSINSMFNNCYALQTVPLFDTSKVTNMNGMFSGCTSLESIPLFNTSAVTDMSYLVSNCQSFKSMPLLDTSRVVNMGGMLQNCYTLQSVPLFNTSAVTNMSYMFYYCYDLHSVPLFNTSKVTVMNNMFTYCFALKSVPLFNTSAVTNMSYMFQYCESLQTVPLFDTSAVTNISYMFQTCRSLPVVPSFNMSYVTNSFDMFIYNFGLGSILAYGWRISFSVINCNLSATALNTLYTNLGTGVTGQVLKVYGNPGTTASNATLAPVGWTIDKTSTS